MHLACSALAAPQASTELVSRLLFLLADCAGRLARVRHRARRPEARQCAHDATSRCASAGLWPSTPPSSMSADSRHPPQVHFGMIRPSAACLWQAQAPRGAQLSSSAQEQHT